MKAGTLEIEIVAEIAKIQEDMRKVQQSITGVGTALKPANDNMVAMNRQADALRARLSPLAAAQQAFSRSVQEAERLYRSGAISLKEYEAASQMARQGFSQQVTAMNRASGAMGRVTASAGAQRAGMQQLSFQIGDVAQQFALGANPMTIFAQQGGQVIQALNMMKGGAGGLVGFLAGPWGAVITGAAMILGTMAAAHLSASDSSEAQKKAEEDLVDAINALHDASVRATQSTYAGVQADIAKANSLRLSAVEARRTLVAELELAKSRAGAAGASVSAGAPGYSNMFNIGQQGVQQANARALQTQIDAQNALIESSKETVRLQRGQLIGMEVTAQHNASAAAALKYDHALDDLNKQLRAGTISEGAYRDAISSALQVRSAEEESAQKSGRVRKDRADRISDEERATQQANKATESFITSLQAEIDRLTMSDYALRQQEVTRQLATAATDAQRQSILDLNDAREQAIGLQKALNELTEQFATKAAQDGHFAVAKYAEKMQEQADSTLNTTEATRALNDQMRELIGMVGSLGGVGSILGTLLGLASGNIGSIGGPLGDLLNIPTSGTVNKDGRDVAKTLGHELQGALQDIFGGPNSTYFKTFSSLIEGAGAGMVIGDAIFGSQTGAEKIGSAIGGALGKAAGTAIAGPIGGAIGSVLGSISGHLYGSLIGGVPSGSATIGGVNGALGLTGTGGNSSARIAASSKSANAIIDSLGALADQFGATIDGSKGAVTVGIRKGNYRVDASGSGTTKVSKGAVDFGDDAEAAAMYAMMDLIKDGVLVGIRKGTQALLSSGTDLQTAISKALKFEGVFADLKAMKDPVAAALDDLTKEFDTLRKIFAEAGATAAEYAQLEELLALKRTEAVEEAKQAKLAELSDQNSLEVELLRLLGKEEDALALARLNELAATKAALQPMQAMIYQLQDARDIIAEFGPLADGLKAFKQELLGGSASGSLAFLTQQFQATAAAAKGGDATALGNLQKDATAYLDAARANASSELEYRRALGEVLAATDSGIFAAEAQVDYAQLQIDAIAANTDVLAGMKTELATYQTALVEQGEWVKSQFRRWEGDGMPIRSDANNPIFTEAAA